MATEWDGGSERRGLAFARGIPGGGIADPTELSGTLAWWEASLGWSSPDWTSQEGSSFVLLGTNTPVQNLTGAPGSTAEIQCQSGDVLEVATGSIGWEGNHFFILFEQQSGGFGVYANAQAGGAGQIWRSGGNLTASLGTALQHASTLSNGTWYIGEVYFNGASSHIRVWGSGGEVGSQADGDVGAGTGRTGLELPITGSTYAVHYGEVVLHTGEATGDDHTNLINYMSTRIGWGDLI